MDQRLIFGLGVSVIFGFARWRFPSVGKPFASSGMALGLGLLLWSAMPSISLGPAVLAIAGLMAVAGAVEWQSNLNKKRAPSIEAAIPSAPQPAPAQASPPAKPEGHDAEVGVPGDVAAPAVPREMPVDRDAILAKITHLYILSHDGISPRMAAGLELPPSDFVNAELAKMGLDWRVGKTEGAKVELVPVKINQSVTSHGQSGGVTAQTVNIRHDD
jgi:hypothetical protein